MAINRKEASPVQAGTLGETSSKNQANHNLFQPTDQSILGNSAADQRHRLHAAIQERGSISTIEARKPDLDIMHPAARIMELRKAGVSIETIRVSVPTEAGKMHSVGRYILAGVEVSHD